MVEETYHLARYLGLFGAYLMPQGPIQLYCNDQSKFNLFNLLICRLPNSNKLILLQTLTPRNFHFCYQATILKLTFFVKETVLECSCPHCSLCGIGTPDCGAEQQTSGEGGDLATPGLLMRVSGDPAQSGQGTRRYLAKGAGSWTVGFSCLGGKSGEETSSSRWWPKNS